MADLTDRNWRADHALRLCLQERQHQLVESLRRVEEERLRIVFSSDAEATEARHVIETALSESARVGAHRVVIKADGITFWSGETMIGVATSSASMPALLAQARKLGSIPDDAKEGGAVLFGPEGPASLRIELTDDAITLTRPTGPDVG